MDERHTGHDLPDRVPTTETDRLWTPWRMRYVGGDQKEQGCIFCNRFAYEDDVASLILSRGEHTFMIMNLFPYNTGHVMLVPNAHLPGPEELDDDTAIEMALAVPRLLRALRAALNPAGFNLGINVGAIAGAGIAAHLHEHVVPRWQGDANFMPILAGTMVLPELLPVTYAKIRSELERDHATAVSLVVLSPNRDRVLLELHQGTGPRLMSIPCGQDPLWRAAIARLEALGATAYVTGWAGEASTRRKTNKTNPALILETEDMCALDSTVNWHAVDDALGRVAEHEARAIKRSLRRLSSSG